MDLDTGEAWVESPSGKTGRKRGQELVGRKKAQKVQKQYSRGGRGWTRIFLAAKALRRKEEEEISTAEARESRWNRDKFPRRVIFHGGRGGIF